ncbi:SubName: Full=Uncharacterized protein {ECO:0000313/EMBL:CCA72933.1} [Serendipita indica DSM 11827]|uniref:Uncharacterized protein n=1 Tax=Serendipita indica (strain DSM 11827) TaxID=1109443 RepID=G4TNP0_SERID|nr:SubName: Full=Uncharacterized protein {ECO:0000313/EMBL:CCA72933.1} [Serendipita indica DSM 11827]CCA72933.1 hypothetical protein PIIN_06869 [Serendipita indica DSM 11827]
MADSDAAKKLIHEAEHALHTASDAVEHTLTSTKHSIKAVDNKLKDEASAWQKTLESILGGKERFWVENPVDGTRLATNMAGWSAFGITAHAWHRGIQRRPVFAAPLRPYMIAVPLWAVLGYFIHHLELRQEEILARRRLLLQRNRGLLEEEDFEKMSLAQGAKERQEKRSKLATLLSDDETGYVKKGGATNDHMQLYRAKLKERLESFERDFDKSPIPISPYPLGNETRPHSITPAEIKRLGGGVSEQKSSSLSSWFGFGRGAQKDEKLEDEVERALA